MSLGSELSPLLPFLRRFSRFLTGNQTTGDILVRDTLEGIAADSSAFPRELGARVGLYRSFHFALAEADMASWRASDDDSLLDTYLYRKLLELPIPTREAFLLTASEGFKLDDVGAIMGINADEARILVESAFKSTPFESISSLISNSSDKFLDQSPVIGGTAYEQFLSLTPAVNAPRARISSGQLHLDDRPVALNDASLDRLELLRSDHLDEVRAVRAEVGNLGGGFDRRFSAITRLLSQPLSDDSSLRLANQVHAIASMKGIVTEELTPATAAGLIAVIDQLVLYCGKFPAWRAFNAFDGGTTTTPEVDELTTVLIGASSSIVADDVKEALVEAVDTAGSPAAAERAYLGGLVHNVLAEAGKYVLAHGKGIAKKFDEKIDEQVSDALASGLANLLIAASTPLLALAVQLPASWAWVGPAIAAAKIVMGRK